MSDSNLGRVKGDKIIVNAAEPTTRKDGTKLLTGDLWINSSTYQVWQYNGTAFEDTGMNIKGAKGDKGATGASPSLDGTILEPILLRPDRNITLDQVLDNGIYWTDDVREQDPSFSVAGVPIGLEQNPLFIRVFRPQRNIFPNQQVTDMVTGDTYKRVFTSDGPGEWKKEGGESKSLYKVDCMLTCCLIFKNGDVEGILPEGENSTLGKLFATLKFSIYLQDMSIFKENQYLSKSVYIYPDYTEGYVDYDFDIENKDNMFRFLGELLATQNWVTEQYTGTGGANPNGQAQLANLRFIPVVGDYYFEKALFTKIIPIGLIANPVSLNNGTAYYEPLLICQLSVPTRKENPATENQTVQFTFANLSPFNSHQYAYKTGGMFRIFAHKIL